MNSEPSKPYYRPESEGAPPSEEEAWQVRQAPPPPGGYPGYAYEGAPEYRRVPPYRGYGPPPPGAAWPPGEAPEYRYANEEKVNEEGAPSGGYPYGARSPEGASYGNEGYRYVYGGAYEQQPPPGAYPVYDRSYVEGLPPPPPPGYAISPSEPYPVYAGQAVPSEYQNRKGPEYDANQKTSKSGAQASGANNNNNNNSATGSYAKSLCNTCVHGCAWGIGFALAQECIFSLCNL
ncbi:hypothetical protein CDCA_CDCA03G0995 [Cyanidium caldarium]|uniref:Uncharacterized protein n=1 Tax=Cyanidium caldarium TaxID=2771 RepID=A0AAV9ISA3_CYACA|nr:hypothetical protein CDCA_CDCA03G0995 [Cyanidium caldarium]